MKHEPSATLSNMKNLRLASSITLHSTEHELSYKSWKDILPILYITPPFRNICSQ
jgi:hypothetical protein